MSKKHVFVIVSGKKRHGKNYFAKRVKVALRKEKISVTEDAFANPMKRFCADVFGIPMEDMETETGKAKNTHLRWCDINQGIAVAFGKSKHTPCTDFITIRELLQVLGTEVFREGFYGPIWAEAPFRKQHTKRMISDESVEDIHMDVVLITDCRFPNEVEEAKKNNAILIRVIRNCKNEDRHISETALDDYKWEHDETVLNHMNDECFDDYIEEELMPKIKGQLYGH